MWSICTFLLTLLILICNPSLAEGSSSVTTPISTASISYTDTTSDNRTSSQTSTSSSITSQTSPGSSGAPSTSISLTSPSTLYQTQTLSSKSVRAEGCNNSTVAAKCARAFGSNSSTFVPSCSSSLPGGCTAVQIACNISLPSNSNYVVLCTTSGAQFISTAQPCVLSNYDFNKTTSALCNQTGISFNCSTDANGQSILSGSTVTTLVRRMNNCTSATTTPSTLQLLKNPVGPEAITAIVILVCAFITVILAGFFFWPKCHIADPAAYALKRATKPASAKAATAATYATSSAGGTGGASGTSRQPDSRVVFQPDKKSATITLPSIPGPSAA